MSYDIYLEAGTGGSEPVTVYDWNYTSNCAPMWRAAGADLAEFHGKTAADCAPILDVAVETMAADPDRFRKLDAPNGWGTYDTLLPRLVELLDAMRRHPATTVRVWR